MMGESGEAEPCLKFKECILIWGNFKKPPYYLTSLSLSWLICHREYLSYRSL